MWLGTEFSSVVLSMRFCYAFCGNGMPFDNDSDVCVLSARVMTRHNAVCAPNLLALQLEPGPCENTDDVDFFFIR